jgi:hypothetical protein
MAHKGRPGPWAPFRDLIGTGDWSQYAQPYKYVWLSWMQFPGTMPHAVQFNVNYPIEIVFNPGDDFWTYPFYYSYVGLGGPADMSFKFWWENNGKNLHCLISADGPLITVRAHCKWDDDVNMSALVYGTPTFELQPDSTTSDSAIWGLPVTSPLYRQTLQLSPVAWADVPP